MIAALSHAQVIHKQNHLLHAEAELIRDGGQPQGTSAGCL